MTLETILNVNQMTGKSLLQEWKNCFESLKSIDNKFTDFSSFLASMETLAASPYKDASMRYFECFNFPSINLKLDFLEQQLMNYLKSIETAEFEEFVSNLSQVMKHRHL